MLRDTLPGAIMKKQATEAKKKNSIKPESAKKMALFVRMAPNNSRNKHEDNKSKLLLLHEKLQKQSVSQ